MMYFIIGLVVIIIGVIIAIPILDLIEHKKAYLLYKKETFLIQVVEEIYNINLDLGAITREQEAKREEIDKLIAEMRYSPAELLDEMQDKLDKLREEYYDSEMEKVAPLKEKLKKLRNYYDYKISLLTKEEKEILINYF